MEYGLIAALIAVVIIGALTQIGTVPASQIRNDRDRSGRLIGPAAVRREGVSSFRPFSCRRLPTFELSAAALRG